MYYVHVVHNNGKCLIHLSILHRKQSDLLWSCKLNPNYIDDVAEIKAAISGFPMHNDEFGNNIVSCDFGTIKEIISDVVRALVSTRVTMWFMRAHLRGARIAFACCRLLPRDCLREVARWVCADEIVELFRLFCRYEMMESIKGLYMRAVRGGRRGPRLVVTHIRAIDSVFPNVFACECTSDEHGPEMQNIRFRAECEECSAPHFCMLVSDTHLDTVGWPAVLKPRGIVTLFEAKFESDQVIEFRHKDPRKWLKS